MRLRSNLEYDSDTEIPKRKGKRTPKRLLKVDDSVKIGIEMSAFNEYHDESSDDEPETIDKQVAEKTVASYVDRVDQRHQKREKKRIRRINKIHLQQEDVKEDNVEDKEEEEVSIPVKKVGNVTFTFLNDKNIQEPSVEELALKTTIINEKRKLWHRAGINRRKVSSGF